MPNPSVALWRPKPITSASARLSSPDAADCPIASPSEKLWSPIPVAMKTASQLRRRHRHDVPLDLELGHRRGAGAEHRLAAAAPEPAVVQREAQQPDRETAGQERRKPEEAPVVAVGQRPFDRLDRGGQRRPTEERAGSLSPWRSGTTSPEADRLHAPDRKAEEDRQPGHRAQEEDLPRAHVRRTLHGLYGRHTSATDSTLDAMAQTHGHSVDEYLETIYFLAFPIGEYRPVDRLDGDRVARRRDARRLARVGRRDAQAARG